MWHKAIWKGHPMRLELTRVGLLVELANHYTTRGAFIYMCVCVCMCARARVYLFPCVYVYDSYWPIDKTLSDATRVGVVLGAVMGVLCIYQRSCISGASLSDCLVSYHYSRWRSLTLLQRCSRCILQSQSTGPNAHCDITHSPFKRLIFPRSI